jgi:hypothetical protein
MELGVVAVGGVPVEALDRGPERAGIDAAIEHCAEQPRDQEWMGPDQGP